MNRRQTMGISLEYQVWRALHILKPVTVPNEKENHIEDCGIRSFIPRLGDPITVSKLKRNLRQRRRRVTRG